MRGGGVDGTGVGLPALGDDNDDGLGTLTLDTGAVGDGADDGERRCFPRCVLQKNRSDYVTCHKLELLLNYKKIFKHHTTTRSQNTRFTP